MKLGRKVTGLSDTWAFLRFDQDSRIAISIVAVRLFLCIFKSLKKPRARFARLRAETRHTLDSQTKFEFSDGFSYECIF